MESTNVYPLFLFQNVLIGTLLALVFGQVAIWLARKVGLIDIPGILPHKQHVTPTPLAGGIALFLALLGGILLLNWQILKEFWNILLPAMLIFGLGLWDDFKRLPARTKFIVQIVAVVALIALGTSVRIIKPGFLGLDHAVAQGLNWFITLLWVVGITNAMNFVDSMDGLVVGLGGIAMAFLVLVTLSSPQAALLQFLSLMAGCLIGLYFYNASPARLFLGDSGAQTIGFLLAAIGILYTPENVAQASSWFLPILILGVPIFDMVLVVFSRLHRKSAVYQAGRDHTYHRLVALGFDSTRAVALMHIAAVALGCVAFIALALEPLPANILFGLICVLGLFTYFYLDRRRK
ncbi:MAG: undecaprenyl/decaprenyl-phosphate alpha-N-acetylglucosaminyl 1-phosphate transferase [Anaerolineales bacterium]|nr:undecaprenyl/decaprenyl-phosphate alpha-N-acetylglucosaminyl 1-phosphate transferase [Anaerolineales bacterium]